jgi:hypothetical protein
MFKTLLPPPPPQKKKKQQQHRHSITGNRYGNNKT